MKRWLMILLFAAGGLATEIAHPAQCSLRSESRVQTGKRRGQGLRRSGRCTIPPVYRDRLSCFR